MNSCTYIVASRGGAVGRSERVNGRLLARLLSSTALASVLLLLPSTSSAQTVTVQEGETVSIPSAEHEPDQISQVVVQLGGKLITNGADIKGSVSGSGKGVIQVEGTAELSGGSISNTTSGWGNALYATGAGANVIAEDLALKTSGTSTTSGSSSSGAYASGGAQIYLNNVTVETTGDYGYAIRTAGDGSHIDANGLTITTSGLQGFGVQAYTGTIIISDSNVSTKGDRAAGAQSSQPNALITAINTHFETQGDKAFGIVADRGGSINITGGSITTYGENAHGVHADYLEPFDD